MATTTTTRPNEHIEAADVKAAAAGHWGEIITALCGVPVESLDPKQHGPCPRCGGKDRFRAFDDFEKTGGVFCNQCHATDNGDGISTIMWSCGCSFSEALEKLAGHLKLAPSSDRGSKNRNGKSKIVATYDYRDADGNLLFQAVRYEPKDFKQRQPKEGGGWIWNLKGVERVLYRLRELLADDPGDWTFVSAGEKDVNRLRPDGLSATCNPMGEGLGKWLDQYSETLAGRKVAILVDNDSTGRQHAARVAKSLSGKATSIKVIELPGLPDGGDVSDWLDAGGTADELLAIVEAAPEWKLEELPEQKTSGKTDEICQAEQAVAGLDSLSAEAVFGDKIIAAMATLFRLDRATYERHKLRLPDGVGKQGFGAAVRQHPNAQVKVDEKDGLTKVLADLIYGENHFAQDVSGRLYRYSNGVYKPRGEQYVRTQVKRLCKEKGWAAEWTKHQAEEVVEFIRVDSPELWDRPAEGHINVANGLLNWRTKELSDHTPDHLSVVQLPVKFDPDATCPNIDKFIGETFPADAIDLAYEIPASAMTGGLSIQKAVLLIGSGGEGKSRYLAMDKAFLGASNVSGVSLHRLESDKFAAARLYGKLANICPDLPSEHLAGTSVFKAIVDGSGDTLTGEYKFKDAFEFRPFCRLMFSANSPPRSQDSSEGFFDRWLVVPFSKRFRGEGGEIPAKTLDARLSTPAELSGLLNKALVALQRLYKTGKFTESDSTRAAFDEFHSTTDPLSVWLDSHTNDAPSLRVEKTALRAAYNEHAERRGMPIITAKSFTAALTRLRPNIREVQRTVNDVPKVWCWNGIGLRSSAGNR